MKKFILISGLLLGSLAFAQAPEKMSYQAVLRNATGQLLQSQNVAVKVSVLQGSSSGAIVFSERLTGTTNSNGLLSMEIGSGTVLSGTFSSIDWSTGNYYLKTETDPTGGTNYTIAGTSQLLSVPYAMYAKSSGGSGTASQWTSNGNNIYNANTGNVGIGTETPESRLTVVPAGGIGISQNNLFGGVKIGFYTDQTSAFLQTHSDHDLKFSTNNSSTQMTLQKGTGNFGIGTSTPTEKLEVNGKSKTNNLQVTNGAGAGKVLTSDATGNATWQTPTGGNWVTNGANISNENAGNVGIGTSTPGSKLEVAGDIKATGNLNIDGVVRIGGGSPGIGKVLTSNGAGLATWEKATKYAFTAKKMNPQTIAPGLVPVKVVFDNVTKEVETSYSAVTGYTILRSAFYQFNVNLNLVNSSGGAFNSNVRVTLTKSNGGGGSEVIYAYVFPGNGTTNVNMGTASFSTVLFLAPNDIINVDLENLTSNNIIVDGSITFPGSSSSFSAFLVN